MTARIEAAGRAVEAAEREPFGGRRVRLCDRARRMLLGMLCHPASWQWPTPEGVTPEELIAGNPEVSADERAALRELEHRLRCVCVPHRPFTHATGSKHKAERIAKRAQKRNSRRLQRREGADVLREQLVAERR